MNQKLLTLGAILGILSISGVAIAQIAEITDVRIYNDILDQKLSDLEIAVAQQDSQLADKEADVTIAEANTVVEKTILIFSMIEVQTLLDQVIAELNSLQ